MRQVFWHLFLLIPISVLPYISGMMGGVYAIGVLCLAFGFLASAIPLAKSLSDSAALLLLKASVYYLPALLLLMILDRAV
jgi:protoheme IX farnesyltransferase